MSASSTAVFTSIGISWDSMLSVVQTLVSTTIQLALDILVALWPFWLGLAVLGLIFGVVFAFLHFFRRRG